MQRWPASRPAARRAAPGGRSPPWSRSCWRAAADDGGDGACGPITREALDPAYLVHVARRPTTDVEYTSDPPTSGPHQPAPPVEGVVDEPITRPVQVGILERGDVLLQHDPDLDAERARRAWRTLAGDGVVVAPNPDLPAPVVATAWLYKRTCDAVDADALAGVHRRAPGQGPGGVTTDAWGIDDGWFDIDGQLAHGAARDRSRRSAPPWASPVGRPVWVGATRRRRRRSTRRAGCAWRTAPTSATVQRLPAGPARSASTTSIPTDGGPTTTLLVGPGPLPPPRRPARVGRDRPGADGALVAELGHRRPRRRARHRRRGSRGRGGRVVALSPLHAPTPVAPIAASPYYPSSRRWRSPLLIRVDEVGAPDRRRPRARRRRAPRCSPTRSCAATSAGRRQRAALEHLWARLGDRERAEAADRWRRAAGRRARAVGDVLRAGRASTATTGGSGPPTLRHPDAPAVARAAADLADRVAFHAWLQQLVEEQLDRGRRRWACACVQDLAVGVDPGGADAWAWQDLLAAGFSIGAPPDEFQTDGQSWGLPPWIPWRLRDAGYRPLAALLRASMVARRRAADRPRDGAHPAVLGARGRRARPTAPTCASPGTSCSRSSPSRAPGPRRSSSARTSAPSRRGSARSSTTGGSCPPRSCGSRTTPPEAVAGASRSPW